MILKNAGIIDVEDAMQRLENDEVFYYTYNEMFYDAKKLLEGGSPYRIRSDQHAAASLGISGLWDYVTDWEVESTWIDDANEGQPVLCRVMINSLQPEVIGKIIGISNGKYLTVEGLEYDFATPIRPEECWGYNEQ